MQHGGIRRGIFCPLNPTKSQLEAGVATLGSLSMYNLGPGARGFRGAWKSICYVEMIQLIPMLTWNAPQRLPNHFRTKKKTPEHAQHAGQNAFERQVAILNPLKKTAKGITVGICQVTYLVKLQSKPPEINSSRSTPREIEENTGVSGDFCWYVCRVQSYPN